MPRYRLSRVAVAHAIAMTAFIGVGATAALADDPPLALPTDARGPTVVSPASAHILPRVRHVGPGAGGIAIESDPGRPDGPDAPRRRRPAPAPTPPPSSPAPAPEGVAGSRPDAPISDPRPAPAVPQPTPAPAPVAPEPPAPAARPDAPPASLAETATLPPPAPPQVPDAPPAGAPARR